jgi:hypothetical protein
MIKSIRLFGAFFLVVSILFSCKKENTAIKDELKIINLNVSIENGKMYSLDLNAYASASDMTLIAKQAITFEASEIVKNELKNIYTFKRNSSIKNVASKETVILKIYEPRNGAHCEKTEIIINFNII